jgi:hypothetical protein
MLFAMASTAAPEVKADAEVAVKEAHVAVKQAQVAVKQAEVDAAEVRDSVCRACMAMDGSLCAV